MGKTKTAVLESVTEEKKSGKEMYEEKMLKHAQAAEALSGAEGRKRAEAEKTAEEKTKVTKVGLKGGERIKVIGGEMPTEELTPDEKPAVTPLRQGFEGHAEGAEGTEIIEKKQKKAKVRSQKYKTAKGKVDKNKHYKLEDSIKLLREVSYSSFDGTVEMNIVVRVSPVNINVTLPYSGGKEKRVELADEKTVEKLKSGKIDFDILLATADMMPKLVPFARVLGPKGMMPNPKAGTLIKSKKDAEKFSGNSLLLKTEPAPNAAQSAAGGKEQQFGIIHTVVGKLSQKDEEIKDNAKVVLEALSKNLVKVYIKSTMSPSIKLQI